MAKAHKLTRTQVDILRCIAEQPRETSMIDTNSLGCLCRWAEFYTLYELDYCEPTVVWNRPDRPARIYLCITPAGREALAAAEREAPDAEAH
jgi:DNA-binding MarR family transcriptional regulator